MIIYYIIGLSPNTSHHTSHNNLPTGDKATSEKLLKYHWKIIHDISITTKTTPRDILTSTHHSSPPHVSATELHIYKPSNSTVIITSQWARMIDLNEPMTAVNNEKRARPNRAALPFIISYCHLIYLSASDTVGLCP